jgi:hypothetical protein
MGDFFVLDHTAGCTVSAGHVTSSIEAIAGIFLEALGSGRSSPLPVAANLRFTENGQELELGDGLWGTVTGLGRYRQVFADHERGEVAVFTTVREKSMFSILSARLKVVSGAVAEIETIVARPIPEYFQGFFSKGAEMLEAMGHPDSIWREEIPLADRHSRSELERVADQYFVGLQKNDGQGDYPFAEGCERLENGIKTTNRALPESPDVSATIMSMTCKAQFESGYFRFVDRIRDRRFLVIDQERGIVVAWAFFDHSATVPEVRLTSGETVRVGLVAPFTWQVAEAFKIERGLITRIEAVMAPAPYGMRPNWPQ